MLTIFVFMQTGFAVHSFGYNGAHVSLQIRKTSSMSQSPQQRQLRLEIPANLNAIYANAVIISQTNTEIVMDFLQVMPNDPRARVQSRVVMTPVSAKSFLKALEQNLTRYEEKHGEIVLPAQPASLADQLFGVIKPPDENDEEEVAE
jgi:hypothetical protein